MNSHAMKKMKLLTPSERARLRGVLQKTIDDPSYSEAIRLARTPVVSPETHARQARDLIAAIDELA